MHSPARRIASGHCLALSMGLVVAASTLAMHAVAGSVPVCGSFDAGNCFVSHGSPACADASCCAVVCAIDTFCCNVSWDTLCANEAGNLCSIQAYTDGVINPRSGHRHRLLSPKAWWPSQAFAAAQGEHLVTIDDGLENTWLRDTFLGQLDGFPRTAWIGLSDEAAEGSFAWSSGAPLGYVNWSAGEPNDLNGEDYVHMLDGSGQWNDLGASATAWGLTEREVAACGPAAGSCFATHGPGCAIESCCHVVCEIDASCCAQAWDAQCVAQASAWCDPGVIAGPVYNPGTGHRYYLLDLTSWSEGEKKALELLGHLASIDTAQENEWLRLNFGVLGGVARDSFIGMHDEAFEGFFAWTNHAAVQWLNWAPGEPNNSANEDHVAMTSSGDWKDVRNTAAGLHAIVEVPCTGDIDSSGIVDGEDLGALLAAWGTTAVHADLDQNGIVDGSDLGLVLASWGICGTSTCCIPSGGVGCDQPGCQSCVCGFDTFCCQVQWDQFCADEAESACYAACQCLVIK